MYPVGRPLFLKSCSMTAPRLAETLPKKPALAAMISSML
jgi:hypothetical protein